MTHAPAIAGTRALFGGMGVSKTPPEQSEKRICEGYKFQRKNSTSSCLHEAGKDGHWIEAFWLFSPAADGPKQTYMTDRYQKGGLGRSA